jgi:hypothetical protein
MFRRTDWLPRRLTVPLAALLVLAGCFQVPTDDAGARPAPSDQLAATVRKALRENADDALTYAGLYTVLASRLDAGAYSTTSEAAAVAGRAADILQVPGVLREIVNDKLNPLLGTPQPLTPELRKQSSDVLRKLAAACREAAL